MKPAAGDGEQQVRQEEREQSSVRRSRVSHRPLRSVSIREPRPVLFYPGATRLSNIACAKAPIILIHEEKISAMVDMLPLLEKVAAKFPDGAQHISSSEQEARDGTHESKDSTGPSVKGIARKSPDSATGDHRGMERRWSGDSYYRAAPTRVRGARH